MSALLRDNPDAEAWAEKQRRELGLRGVFAKTEVAVVWADTRGEDGEILVPVDPRAIVDEINSEGMPLLGGHDPGAPIGRIIAAALFRDHEGGSFVAAVAGFYGDATQVSFRQLGVDADLAVPLPTELPPLQQDTRLLIATDPREVEPEWLDRVLRDAPLEVRRSDLSHNAADAVHELIRIGLPFVVLVWNPFVASFASEAGKATYAGVHKWLRTFFEKLSERNNPIVEVQSFQRGCQISFLFRSKNVKTLYAAHDGLAAAAAQGARLVDHLVARGGPPRTLTYEFDPEAGRWYPSYAELMDGTFVSDRNILVAFEQLPSELSLGLVRERDEPRKK